MFFFHKEHGVCEEAPLVVQKEKRSMSTFKKIEKVRSEDGYRLDGRHLAEGDMVYMLWPNGIVQAVEIVYHQEESQARPKIKFRVSIYGAVMVLGRPKGVLFANTPALPAQAEPPAASPTA